MKTFLGCFEDWRVFSELFVLIENQNQAIRKIAQKLYWLKEVVVQVHISFLKMYFPYMGVAPSQLMQVFR